MQREPLRLAAAVACVAMATFLILLQFVLTPDGALPRVFFLLFTTLWLFGALMLLAAPLFGAAGTALWGLVAGVQAVREHGLAAPEDAFNALGSLATAGLAAAYLADRARAARRSAAADGTREG